MRSFVVDKKKKEEHIHVSVSTAKNAESKFMPLNIHELLKRLRYTNSAACHWLATKRDVINIQQLSFRSGVCLSKSDEYRLTRENIFDPFS